MKNKAVLRSLTAIAFIGVVTGMAPVVRASSCSAANIAGPYGYTTTGSVVNPPVGPFATVGHVRFNASGNFSGAQTTSIAGNLFDEIVSGTFTVNSNCTGTAIVNVFHGTTLVRSTNLDLVWDDNRSEIRAIFLTRGTVLTIIARRIGSEEEQD